MLTQQTILGTPGEAGATTRVTELFGIITDVVINGLDNLPTQVNNGISSVKIPEKIDLERLLLITNASDNNVLYTFNDPSKGATAEYRREYSADTSNPTAYVDPDFPKAYHGNDTITIGQPDPQITRHMLESVFAELTRNFGQPLSTDVLKQVRGSLAHASGDDLLDSLIALGYLQVNTGNLDLACEIFQLLLSHRPDLVAAHMGMGSARAMLRA